jgi:hypothetical protein
MMLLASEYRVTKCAGIAAGPGALYSIRAETILATSSSKDV